MKTVKHFYSECPYNPDGPTRWYFKETNCPWCLQKEVLWYEQEYRDEPEDAVGWITQRLL